MRIAAIIVAAGRGERLGGEDGPKQYLRLAGKSILARSMAAFLDHERIDRIQPVIHAGDDGLYRRQTLPHEKLLAPVAGGATRQHSVLAGLTALCGDPPDIVLIHDAARPFLRPALIDRLLDGVKAGTGAAPGLALTDSLKRVNREKRVAATVDRDLLFSVQTPQAFIFAEILKAHEAAAKSGETRLSDDCAVAERAGLAVTIVEGDPSNIKITTRRDLESARQWLSARPDVRTGQGYDVHRLVPGDKITLCGLELPHSASLEGHSDADVGLHALTDALLGAIGEGDIGSHFPPSDPKWKDASSQIFLHRAASLVRQCGGEITHLDVTLICETPKIGPHRQAMRERIAGVVGVETARVSVKATTNEGVGFVGRKEGIAALATATVIFDGFRHDE